MPLYILPIANIMV